MAKPAKFAHVVYQTRRYDQMIAWYQDVFEATVVHQDPALAFLTYDDEHHRFAFANLDVLNPGGGDQRGGIGVNHVAYTYADIGDLLATYKRLKAKGITPYWPIHHGPTLSLYYRDPDGNRMEFQVDACSVDDANAYMRSDAFAANPIGVTIDPDDLLARLEGGADPNSLITMPAGPPSAIPDAHGFG
ncbi:VOC family protein [Phenylobacterium sp.]|uniref:VOC family protein n=1 Tax=Phenylobacterium sp. TaxID=1871053 RepID=UPI003D2A1B23